jgi:hypothetical protein
MDELSENTKLDLLKHLHVKAREEINYHRERQDKVFKWSSNILLLVIGTLLVVDSTKSFLWSQQGIVGKVIASITILIVVVFSIQWQQRNRKWQEESVEVLERIETLLHCFDKGYYGTPDDIALYPERWAEPRDLHKRLSLTERIFRVNYVSAIALLGILAIAMVWFSGN